MDKSKIAGSIREIKGATKIVVSKFLGDAKLQSDGKAHSYYGAAGLGGVLGIVLVVIIVLWFFGR